MAVKIKLKRLGKIRNPQFRVVIADSKTARNGRSIEEIGIYYPKEEPSRIEINSDRALYWLGVGAQPTEAVMVLLKITGDWQKFKGLPGTEGTLRVKGAKIDKRTVFAAAVEDAAKTKSEPEAKPKKKVEEVVEKSEPVVEVSSDEVVENVAEVTETSGEESTSE